MGEMSMVRSSRPKLAATLVASLAEECQAHMDNLTSLFTKLGISIAENKTVGPLAMVTYLGIEIDAVEQQIRLPVEKYQELLVLLAVWQDKRKCTNRELLSLIGSLSFASKVVKPGRMFMRRHIDLSTTVSGLNHRITLNAESRADIQWWLICEVYALV